MDLALFSSQVVRNFEIELIEMDLAVFICQVLRNREIEFKRNGFGRVQQPGA